jgi:hypothetical protein
MFPFVRADSTVSLLSSFLVFPVAVKNVSPGAEQCQEELYLFFRRPSDFSSSALSKAAVDKHPDNNPIKATVIIIKIITRNFSSLFVIIKSFIYNIQ